ncbi:MAG TPA: DUF4846 domain-containing protein [Thermoanaerobacterales bacterium]|nr:DUF4846 domain-containing protein [Thermoanaerobacterales bacterium]
MKRKIFICLLLGMIVFALMNLASYICGRIQEGHQVNRTGGEVLQAPSAKQGRGENIINENGKTLFERINAPYGFERVEVEPGSFGEYLRNLPLKPHGSKVHYYDGKVKGNNVYEAVIDMDVGTKDLQQCADAVIRLRAEYLFGKRQYDRIHFNFTNGFRADYSKWMQGYRIKVSGNKAAWVKTAGHSADYEDFRRYLDTVFSYAGTLSLSRELKPVSLEKMEIGDVFIQGGTPGHCVIVVDMAENRETGEKIFMLAQSYMPAQDIHVLKNHDDPGMSPWYAVKPERALVTPEWTFEWSDLKRFE